MRLKHTDRNTGGNIEVIRGEQGFSQMTHAKDYNKDFLSIVWNHDQEQTIIIDEKKRTFPANTILPLVIGQTFRLEKPEAVTAWRFNREFYCIIDHDVEVSCAGFLFFGTAETMFVQLDDVYQRKLELLFQVFEDEFETVDDIQSEMIRMLLKRLIIIITRLGKDQYLDENSLTQDKLDIIRNYNVLVEKNFKQEHSVQFYADQLMRSPKTLSNLFSIYNHETPLKVIHNRITLEAKRLMYYSDLSNKEIAYEVGFDDAAYFSNFFKRNTGYSPTDFRKLKENMTAGK